MNLDNSEMMVMRIRDWVFNFEDVSVYSYLGMNLVPSLMWNVGYAFVWKG